MAKGGARKGSGRKKGVSKSNTKIIRDKVLAEGITPLEVMNNIMREAYSKALIESDPLKRGNLLEFALSSAKDAAPYMHPRLAAITVGNKDGQPFVFVAPNYRELLDNIARELRAKGLPAPQIPA